jgi:hypothetical protein
VGRFDLDRRTASALESCKRIRKIDLALVESNAKYKIVKITFQGTR